VTSQPAGRRLHHVNVVVPPGATDEVLPFYASVLGLTQVAKPAQAGSSSGAWLDVAPGMQVHLSEREGQPHPDAHFGLVVDDFDAVRARLADAGAPWTDQAPVFGGRRGFTRDPAGNRIEVIEAPAG
jgi:catechol 2,3-dioxygenase-like lactoylglutathione lyase family enzyme